MASNRTSSTARLVALGQVLMSSLPRDQPPVPDRAVQLYETWLNKTGGLVPQLASRADSRLVQELSRGLQRMTIPGLFRHHSLRKRWIENRVHRRIEGGVEQIVVIGSGLDPLPVRLSETYENLACVELDRSGPQAIKQPELNKAGVVFFPIELEEDSLTDRLNSVNRIDQSVPTLFLMEGVSMYLPGEIVCDLLEEMAHFGEPNNECVITVMDECEGSIQFHNGTELSRQWLNWAGEPFRWGYPKQALPNLLQQHGLDPIDIVDNETLRSQLMAPDENQRIAEGELIVHARAR